MYRSKRNWGIAALIIFVLAAGGFIYWQHLSLQQLKEELAQDEKIVKEMTKPKVQHDVSFADQKPPDEPGFVWVRHGDHWDKVAIDAPGTGQEAPSVDVAQDAQPLSNNGGGASTEVVYPNPDNPVQYLREYLEERGHWSAAYIPDFPPEDAEAAALAQNIITMLAHEDAGNELLDGPAEAANREYLQTLEHYRISTDQRSFDLYKLSWAFLDAPLGGDASNMFFGK